MVPISDTTFTPKRIIIPKTSIGLIPDCPVIEAAIAVVSQTPTIVRRDGISVISVNVVRNTATTAKR
jgi:hypothetical protein